ncbi:ATP-binding protein [Carnobacterium maltaromaticum]|uniref:ATP-binding protein n=1 Tax=Carnobacterium maltaromaticum TaxID=2751 RepID=UPI003990C313
MYLGVGDTGEILGVDKSTISATKTNLSTAINSPNKINPPLYLALEELEVEGEMVLFTYIPISSQVHHLNQHKIMNRNTSDVVLILRIIPMMFKRYFVVRMLHLLKIKFIPFET